MAKSLNELAHPLAAKSKKATLLQFIIQKQMIQKAPLVKVVRVIKINGGTGAASSYCWETLFEKQIDVKQYLLGSWS